MPYYDVECTKPGAIDRVTCRVKAADFGTIVNRLRAAGFEPASVTQLVGGTWREHLTERPIGTIAGIGFSVVTAALFAQYFRLAISEVPMAFVLLVVFFVLGVPLLIGVWQGMRQRARGSTNQQVSDRDLNIQIEGLRTDQRRSSLAPMQVVMLGFCVCAAMSPLLKLAELTGPEAKVLGETVPPFLILPVFAMNGVDANLRLTRGPVLRL